MPQHVEFRLPDVGEGLTEADIVGWLVSVGEVITVNQNIVEIETAKSLVELPSPYAGTVAELLVASGDTVEVGTPIIRIDTGADAPAGGGAAGGAAASEASGGSSTTAPEGSVGAAPEPEGSGDVLVGYGTSRASATRRPRRPAGGPPAPAANGAPGAGRAADAVQAGVEVGPGAVAQAAPVPEPAAAPPTATTPMAPPATSTPAPEQPGAPASEPARPGPAVDVRVLAKPPVRKLAKDLGIDLSRVPATGPGGIVTRADVLSAAERSAPERLVQKADDDRPWLDGGTVSADGRQTRVPVRSVRARTADAMVASAFTAPHVTEFVTLDVTKSMRLVERLKADREFADVRVTPLLIAAKALTLAIRRHPMISASWDDETQEIVYKHYINLGIAAATPRGLVVPNIKDAHRLSLHELATELAELTTTARAGKTQPKAMSDGTVTITNVGIFGIDTGTPILNPGESAILALGAITERPWVHKGKVKPRWVTQLALSFDHRLVDGELGSRVLHDVAVIMEHPEQALVWG
ncbi:MAG TPA: 2-oxo acid dehydrogenase subunit E2 [Candidatus Ruania gallistercoris]|uniref:Dihydrolipoamide acetyltransferase component of pyruvate dehydrogenase complex n=1 Tax=Candidatus Ruania gallistercoris TaxID=2838746 RepID=A0A9D2EEJ7_9MICO|nr:2-oxo acid dehydrogenase subunit E2 [Candidatus Ruania gallistercoris]